MVENPEFERLVEQARERLQAFEQLSYETYAVVGAAVEARIRSNPRPTEEEFSMGAFVEMIEPQVRDAVLEFRRKGYATHSSGFFGRFGDIQCIDGPFKIDLFTRRKLAKLGVEVKREGGPFTPYTFVMFRPEEPDMGKIEAKWKQITAQLPDKGRRARMSETAGGDRFRSQYGVSKVR